jgi:hypothetical protein
MQRHKEEHHDEIRLSRTEVLQIRDLFDHME